MAERPQPTIRLSLSPADLNLVLVAIGQFPYVEVHELIERIQSQAGPQLVSLAAASAAAAGEE